MKKILLLIFFISPLLTIGQTIQFSLSDSTNKVCYKETVKVSDDFTKIDLFQRFKDWIQLNLAAENKVLHKEDLKEGIINAKGFAGYNTRLNNAEYNNKLTWTIIFKARNGGYSYEMTDIYSSENASGSNAHTASWVTPIEDLVLKDIAFKENGDYKPIYKMHAQGTDKSIKELIASLKTFIEPPSAFASLKIEAEKPTPAITNASNTADPIPTANNILVKKDTLSITTGSKLIADSTLSLKKADSLNSTNLHAVKTGKTDSLLSQNTTKSVFKSDSLIKKVPLKSPLKISLPTPPFIHMVHGGLASSKLDFPICDSTNKIYYAAIIKADSMSTKVEFHQRIKDWINVNFLQENKVLHKDDLKEGVIIAKGFSGYFTTLNSAQFEHKLTWTMTLRFQNGAYSYQMTDIYTSENASGTNTYTASWITPIEDLILQGASFKENGDYKPLNKMHAIAVDKSIKEVIESLKNALQPVTVLMEVKGGG